MKAICYLIICSAILFSCQKKTGKNNATVIKNCTGTYLRIDSKDYLVCNSEKLAHYSHGVTISATYKHIDECNNEPACMMAYAYEGAIKVMKVK